MEGRSQHSEGDLTPCVLKKRELPPSALGLEDLRGTSRIREAQEIEEGGLAERGKPLETEDQRLEGEDKGKGEESLLQRGC